MSDTLIVIPVRAGSVGIPNKALRLLVGSSPLDRTLCTAQATGADVVIATDLALTASVMVYPLPPELARGDVPLDAPIHAALTYVERLVYPRTYQAVVTMQCTSPFTKRETVERAIRMSQDLHTTVLTVRDDRGLRWESAALESAILTTRAPRRVTRQRMPPCWRETGALFVTPRQWVEPTSRLSHTAHLIEVTGAEAVDLDTMEDWWIAEHYATQETAVVESRQPVAVR